MMVNSPVGVNTNIAYGETISVAQNFGAVGRDATVRIGNATVVGGGSARSTVRNVSFDDGTEWSGTSSATLDGLKIVKDGEKLTIDGISYKRRRVGIKGRREDVFVPEGLELAAEGARKRCARTTAFSAYSLFGRLPSATMKRVMEGSSSRLPGAAGAGDPSAMGSLGLRRDWRRR